jgi:hypothetical protein
VGVENINPQEELKKLEAQIEAAADLPALKPIYYRLNEIIQAFPGDFDVQFSGDAIKQRLIARGNILKQQVNAPPPAAAPAPPPPPPPPVIPIARPEPPPPLAFPDTTAAAPTAPPEPPVAPPPSLHSEPTAALSPTPLPLPFDSFDSPAREPSTPAMDVPPVPLPPPPSVQQARPAPPPVRPEKVHPARAALVGSIAGLLAGLVLIVWVIHRSGQHNAPEATATAATVQVDLATDPTGAQVKVVADPSAAGGGKGGACTSSCTLSLAPGVYQVTASMDGFDTATNTVTVTAGQPALVSLTLQPQQQTVRLLTDLDQGKVAVDNGPPIDLQEGQAVLDKMAKGAHTIKVTGKNGEATFSVEMADARMPTITGPVAARNMIAVLVSSFGKQARVVTNAGPWKLAVNGQPQSDAGPGGTNLTNFQPGMNEIVVGDGKDQRNMSETFSAAPTLTAFLKSDVNAGTLIVSAGQDGVSVIVNDKEYPRRTQRGQLRLQTLGKVTVRVAKPGYLDAPEQTVEVKKGAEVRLQFELKPQPQLATLEIQGAMAGAEVWIDQKNAGAVGPDGTFTIGTIQPGERSIELRREQYVPKRLQRSFHAGQTVMLAGGDVALAAAHSTVRFTRNPATAAITYRRADETESHEVRGNSIDLPPGTYTFSAKAPGFTESTTRVQLAVGETRDVELTLSHEHPVAPPTPAATGMAEFENPEGWKKEGENWVHTGGGFVPYKLPPKGVFTFTVELVKGGGVFRAGQIRWCLRYLDPKNYLLYEMDRKNFWAGSVDKGKRTERVKAPHNIANQKAFTIQMEVTPERIVQRVRVGNEWKTLDTLAASGQDLTQGKFAFLIQGNDEIAISDFKFQPR